MDDNQCDTKFSNSDKYIYIKKENNFIILNENNEKIIKNITINNL